MDIRDDSGFGGINALAVSVASMSEVLVGRGLGTNLISMSKDPLRKRHWLARTLFPIVVQLGPTTPAMDTENGPQADTRSDCVDGIGWIGPGDGLNSYERVQRPTVRG